jgi:flagellar hook assembly protein FlgD
LCSTIAFDVPGTPGEKEHVEVTVYDIRLRRVSTLIESELEPGSYKLQWNGRDDRGARVSSGIYLYTLRAGERTFTRKMTVVK